MNIALRFVVFIVAATTAFAQSSDSPAPNPLEQMLARNRQSPDSCPEGTRLTGIWPADAVRFGEGALQHGCVLIAGTRRHGPWTIFYATGERRATMNYDKGSRDGDYREFHRGGQPMTAGRYEAGKRASKWQWWAPDGTLLREAVHAAGKEDGPLSCPPGREARSTNGEASVETSCFNGQVKDGPSRSWYVDGGKKAEGGFAGGLQTGRWLEWQPSGLPASDCVFIDGRKHGVCRTFGPSGEKHAEETYSAGMKDGPSREWSHGGRLMFEGMYARGVRVGRHARWDDRGNIRSLETFDDGRPREFARPCADWSNRVTEALKGFSESVKSMKAGEDVEIEDVNKSIQQKAEPDLKLMYEIVAEPVDDGITVRAVGRPGTHVAGDRWTGRDGQVEHVETHCIEPKSGG